MKAKKITQRDLNTYIKIVKDNNLSGLISSMMSRGVQVPAVKLINSAMYGLYIKSPSKFWQIMKAVKYNRKAGNYTTSMNFNRLVGRTPEIQRVKALKEKGSIRYAGNRNIYSKKAGVPSGGSSLSRQQPRIPIKDISINPYRE